MSLATEPKKSPKPSRQALIHPAANFSRPRLVVFVLAFALIGYLIFRTFAASPLVASMEAEQMTLPYNGVVLSSSTASGGKLIALDSNGSATGTVSFPSSVSSFTVTAKGDQCSGAPAMTVAVDGHVLLNNTAVVSTNWAGYSYTLGSDIGAGTHDLSISFTNDYSSAAKIRGHKTTGACDRNLYVDVSNFYGPAPVAPPPTVALSVSPTTVTAGQASTLTWNSANASSCTAGGAWSGSQPLSGSASTGALNQTSTYSLTCSGSGGSATVSTTVTVNATQPQSSIYWGAFMDGDNTYSYYYGDPAPNGQPWQDAPWGNTGNTWDRFEQNAGKKVSVCHYGQPNPWTQTTFYNSTADICTNRGALVTMDMDTGSVPLRDIAAGKYDSYIAAWAKNVKAWGRPFFLRLDTEMNGTWEAYGPGGTNSNTPQDFINMWRHFHDVAVANGATNITWFWVPNVGTTTAGSTYSLDQFYPGDAYVDWTGLDGYNQDATYTGFYSLFKPSYDMLLSIAPTKPIGIGETSSHEYGGQKAGWITDALTTQLPRNFPKIKMLLWFNWRIYENGVWKDWPIESSATAQAAFKAGIASSYYTPGSSSIVNLPPLTKVPPLP